MALPNLLIVGVKKAGTSSLFDYLSQHPDICPASVKETGFFTPLMRDDGRLRPLQHYAQYFGAWRGERYRMEATPEYFYGGARVIDAIARTLPRPRILVTLRNPATRLWSHYLMKKRIGSSAVAGASFEEYISRCEALGGQTDHLQENRGYAALAQGRYSDYIGGWFDEFGENLRVLFLEYWSEQPYGETRETSRWLGIDEEVVASFDYSVMNKAVDYRRQKVAKAARKVYKPAAKLLRQRPRLSGLFHTLAYLPTIHDALNSEAAHQETMKPDTRRHLDDFYRSSNRQLAVDLARRGYRSLPSWLNSD